MKKNTKDLQYQLEKEMYLWRLYVGTGMSAIMVILCLEDINGFIIVPGLFLLLFVFLLLYSCFSKIKRKILSHYGVRHDAEIVKAKYEDGTGSWAGFSFYYLEIDFINNRGKKKTLYTPAYIGNPNDYLKSANCSVYEWKGFYVEGDFQMRDEREYFGYGPIPTERKRFIWR